MDGSMKGKRALVFGVASDTSIAWAIAQELAAAGAKVTLGYQKRFLSRLMELTKGCDWIEDKLECDVTDEASVEAFVKSTNGQYDALVHCIAFAPAEALGNEVTLTKQADFELAMTISAYSLVRLVQACEPIMTEGGSVVALTYLGGDRVVPGYRIMGTAKAALQELVRELACVVGPSKGIRVNAISAGPIRTLAASGVPGFDAILDWMQSNAPLRRNVNQQDVGKAAKFLLGDDASGITGQTIYVDAGYCITGAPPHLQQIQDALAGEAPTPAAAPAKKPLLFG